MASAIMVIGVLLAILVFSVPLCYFAYLGTSEQRDLSMPTTEAGDDGAVETAEDRPA